MKGELLGGPEEAGLQTDAGRAEACLLQAVAAARQHDARSLELRAVISLCRLWSRQGKTAAAQRLLADTHGWFDEGFATADLWEAASLLEDWRDERH